MERAIGEVLGSDEQGKITRRRFVEGLSLLGACSAIAPAAVAATPIASGRVEQLENDAVHVWRTTVVPHGPLALHRHDYPRIVVALTGGTMELVDSSGARERHVWKTGNAYLLPAMPPGAMHSDVNAGDATMELMVIELKHEK